MKTIPTTASRDILVSTGELYERLALELTRQLSSDSDIRSHLMKRERSNHARKELTRATCYIGLPQSRLEKVVVRFLSQGGLSVSTRNIKSNTSVPTKRRCLRRARGIRFDGSEESNRIKHMGGLADKRGSRQ